MSLAVAPAPSFPAADETALADLRAYLAAKDPGLTPAAVDARVALLLAACLEQDSLCCDRPPLRDVERALVRVWLMPTADHADGYLAAVAPVLRESLRRERAGGAGSGPRRRRRS